MGYSRAGEWGLIEVRRRGFDPVSCHTDWVFSSYVLRVTTAEQPVRVKAGKKYFATGLD